MPGPGDPLRRRVYDLPPEQVFNADVPRDLTPVSQARAVALRAGWQPVVDAYYERWLEDDTCDTHPRGR